MLDPALFPVRRPCRAWADKRRTGFEFDLFDYKDVVGAGKSVWTALKAQKDRDQARRWAIEDRLQDRAWGQEDKDREIATTAPQVDTAWGTGDAYRRIKGESGAQRLARINREVAAGASPTRR